MSSSTRVGLLLIAAALVLVGLPNAAADKPPACWPACDVPVNTHTNIAVGQGGNQTLAAQQSTSVQVGERTFQLQGGASAFDANGRPCEAARVSGGRPQLTVYPSVLGIVQLNPRCANVIVRGP